MGRLALQFLPQFSNAGFSCNSSEVSDRVRIRSNLEKDLLTGQISLRSIPTAAEFTVTKEPPKAKAESQH